VTAEIANAVAFVLFTVLLLIGAGSTIARGLRYKRAGARLPVLWARDRDLVAGLALPFVLIFGARTLGFAPSVAGQLWWTLLTAVPAVYGVGRYVWFELFVIEKHHRRPEVTE
jgi:hypothetical protein